MEGSVIGGTVEFDAAPWRGGVSGIAVSWLSLSRFDERRVTRSDIGAPRPMATQRHRWGSKYHRDVSAWPVAGGGRFRAAIHRGREPRRIHAVMIIIVFTTGKHQPQRP